MHFKSFEDLDLQHAERIVITNEETEVFYGDYLGDYKKPAKTFLFRNSSREQEEVTHIHKMQRVDRVVPPPSLHFVAGQDGIRTLKP